MHTMEINNDNYNNMKATTTFTELNSMSDAHLQTMSHDTTLSLEVRKMVAYEIHIRTIELPEEWKLSN